MLLGGALTRTLIKSALQECPTLYHTIDEGDLSTVGQLRPGAASILPDR